MRLIEKILNSKIFERFRRQLILRTGIYCRIKRLNASSSEPLRTVMLLKHFNVNCVIDVGANTGQFAESLIDFGYKGKIISFEPVSECYNQLVKRSERSSNWIVPERCAIGSENKEIVINISEDSVFSSVLEIKDSYASQLPKSRIVKTEKANLYRLDAIIEKYINDTDRVLLKIDTQGFEKEVLDGAQELMKKIIGLKIEIPLYPIYNDTKWIFKEIFDFTNKNNLYPYSITPEGVDLRTGRMNTIDGLFFKNI